MRRVTLTLLAVTLTLPVMAAAAAQPVEDPDPASDPTTVLYEESEEVIANPQRGFYRHTETHYRADSSGYTPLDGSVLASYREDGITQVLRVFYLEKFAATPTLDQEWLDLVQADYDTAREAGVSVITRFAYVQGGAWPYEPPYGDAPLEVVLAHIEQLTPVLRANADVIPVVQNGFIGLWGEGYYTDHFVADPADPGVVTEADWRARSAVIEALLQALPADRSVQARTMLSKQQLLGVPSGAGSAITAADAFTDTPLARVGHRNDCLLASPDDFGTFLSDPLELDQEYLEADSLYTPVGGETCAVNPPRSEWPSASAELERYHYSYLNRDYNTDVLDSWGAAGIEETANRLGYRFVLTDSTVTPTAEGGVDVEIRVRNDGWAAPYTPRQAVLVLEGEGSREEVALAGGDARTWLPGTTTTLTASLTALEGTTDPMVSAAGLPPGVYDLALALPAADAGTADDPRFAIRTANAGTWDVEGGVNDLGQQASVLAAPEPPTQAPEPTATPGPPESPTTDPAGDSAGPADGSETSPTAAGPGGATSADGEPSTAPGSGALAATGATSSAAVVTLGALLALVGTGLLLLRRYAAAR